MTADFLPSEGLRTERQSVRRAAAPRWDDALRLLRLGVVVLPLGVLALWGWRSWQAEAARGAEAVQRNAQLVREYALRVLQPQERLLDTVIAMLVEVERDRLPPETVMRRLAALTRGNGAPLSVGVVNGAGLMTAASGVGAIGLDVRDRGYFALAREAPPGAVRLERQVLQPGGQDAVVMARRRPGAEFAGLVLATVPVRAFTDFFGTLALDSGASASLLRADGTLLVRHRPEAPAIRLPPDAPAIRAIADAESGLYRALARSDGVERVYGFARVEGLPLYAHFGIATASICDRWLRGLAPVAALLLLASALGFMAVDRGVRALRAEEERRRADAATREARHAAELHEMLLRELHHRVKNSLATVLALTRLRAGGDGQADRVLEQRVFALAKVHDLLHVSSFLSRLDVAAFLRALCASPAIVPPGSRARVTVEAERVEVDVERATPLALISAELVANALRHAFPDGRRGRVEVILRAPPQPGGMASLTVRDDGVGLPEGGWPKGGRSGLGLVERLAAQMGGRLSARGEAGLDVTLSFPSAQRE
jgi:two-component sensor histidine kinase